MFDADENGRISQNRVENLIITVLFMYRKFIGRMRLKDKCKF